MRKVYAVVLTLLASGADARNDRWEVVPGLTSANLASTPWVLLSSAGLSWPDGRQAIVTFWTGSRNLREKDTLYIRCTAYFDASMRATGEKCEQPAEGRDIPP